MFAEIIFHAVQNISSRYISSKIYIASKIVSVSTLILNLKIASSFVDALRDGGSNNMHLRKRSIVLNAIFSSSL